MLYNLESCNVISAVNPNNIDNVCDPTNAFNEEDEDLDNPLDD